MSTTRRTLLAGAAAALPRLALAQPALAQPAVAQPAVAQPAVVGGDRASTLRYIPQADVTVLDPLGTTAYPTRNHGFMCWDTLYRIDSQFRPQPQLAEGHRVEDDGKRWTFTLRDGPTFHDGEKVRAADAVASIKRWMPKDTHGQTLLARLDEIRALDDRRIEMRLKRPFRPDAGRARQGVLLPLLHLPAALRRDRPGQAVHRGGRLRPLPLRRRRARVRRAGWSIARFDRYIPTPVGTPDMVAGPKLANFERVEWKVIPDPATSAAAMQAGEMDWWEVVDPDLNALLARARNVVLDRIDEGGTYAGLRLNQLFPPFDDPALRRALFPIISQADFMQSVAGDKRSMWKDGIGFFAAASPLASDAGMAALTGPRDPAKTKSALAAAGQEGAKIVALHATNVSNQKALMSVGVDTLQRAGFAVEDATSDWGSVLQRRANRNPPAKGGWNALIALFSGAELTTPAGHVLLRGNGADAWFGWPKAPKLEALRDQWFDAPDLDAQKRIAREIQLQAFEDVPYIPLGQYFTRFRLPKGPDRHPPRHPASAERPPGLMSGPRARSSVGQSGPLITAWSQVRALPGAPFPTAAVASTISPPLSHSLFSPRTRPKGAMLRCHISP